MHQDLIRVLEQTYPRLRQRGNNWVFERRGDHCSLQRFSLPRDQAELLKHLKTLTPRLRAELELALLKQEHQADPTSVDERAVMRAIGLPQN